MDRRIFLKSLAAGVLVSGSSSVLFNACSSSNEQEPPVPPVRGPQALRIPNVINGSGTLHAAPGSVEFWNGIPTSGMITINGSYLGPTIKLRKGAQVSIQFQNGLSQLSNIHWHGLNVPAVMDGHPMDAIAPGRNFNYNFPIIDRAGTYWYHAHPDMMTGEQAYKGLAGVLIVNDEEEDALNLPSGEFDIPLVLQDKRVNAKNEIIWDRTPDDIPPGFLGDLMCVNGTPDAYHEVGKALYRLRLVNASNARIYNVGFADERDIHLIANDCGLIEQTVAVKSVKITPGERAEILVDFWDDDMGTSVILKSLPFVYESDHQNPDFPQGKEFDLVRFDVKKDTTNTNDIPTSLSVIEKIDVSNPNEQRTFNLTMDHSQEYGQHRINGLVFDMHRSEFSVKLGDTEIWQIDNRSTAVHGMHIHGTQFQILQRIGGALAPTDLGWKDTVAMGPGESVKIAVRFTTYKGMYIFHCHILEHEDDGMMLNFTVA